MSISNALVVGGGIGGLSVAAALAQRGIAVTLIEQADALREVGAGLQISPNGLSVLRGLGLEAQLMRKNAVQAQAVQLKDFRAGTPVARLDLAKSKVGQGYYFVHRADLIDILAAAAKLGNVSFDLGQKVAAVHPGPTPMVELEDGRMRRAELIVAADGIHSVARAQFNGPDRAAFSGQVAWRAMVPNTVNHPDEAQVSMGPGCHLVSYPLRGGRMVNLVAVQERDAWAAEGWQQRDRPENLRTAFASFGGMVPELLNAVEDVTLWGLHLHPVAPNWGQGGVALLGDAAHPTLPFLAQGANMALEDAWVLAEAVHRYGAPGIAQYQAQRQGRVARVIAASEKNAARYHMRPGFIRSVAHLGLRMGSRLAPGPMLSQFDWLYAKDVTRPDR